LNKIPRAGQSFKKFFESILPKDSRITVRPMFGNLAAFVNGNMCAGVFGESIFLRLSEDDRTELLKNAKEPLHSSQ
jgi:TfoX/Sxy family transcriptional regulator of competence genes